MMMTQNIFIHVIDSKALEQHVNIQKEDSGKPLKLSHYEHLLVLLENVCDFC